MKSKLCKVLEFISSYTKFWSIFSYYYFYLLYFSIFSPGADRMGEGTGTDEKEVELRIWSRNQNCSRAFSAALE